VPAPLQADYFCTCCNTPFINDYPLDDQGVCAVCRSGLRGFDRASCFGFYEGPLRSLIHLYKYSGMKPLARPLAKYLERAIAIDETFDAVAAVPLHWRKKWQRGFNRNCWPATSRSAAIFRSSNRSAADGPRPCRQASPWRAAAAMSRELSFCAPARTLKTKEFY